MDLSHPGVWLNPTIVFQITFSWSHYQDSGLLISLAWCLIRPQKPENLAQKISHINITNLSSLLWTAARTPAVRNEQFIRESSLTGTNVLVNCKDLSLKDQSITLLQFLMKDSLLTYFSYHNFFTFTFTGRCTNPLLYAAHVTRWIYMNLTSEIWQPTNLVVGNLHRNQSSFQHQNNSGLSRNLRSILSLKMCCVKQLL